MSWENLKDAYRTRLGNLTAKSVLVLIVDEANAEGLAFVSLDRVASLTEINKRTTLRIIQVFSEIDLVNRAEASLKGRVLPAFQVNLARLGLDLRESFTPMYKIAQRKKGGGKCLRDMCAGVAETSRSVAATSASVAETLPPDPLLGGPLLFPLKSPHPQTPSGEGAIDRGVAQVCSALGVTADPSTRRLRAVIHGAIALKCEKGEPAPTVALRMIAAWNKQAQMSPFLAVKYGMRKFFNTGIWDNENRWHWNEELLRRRGEASAGSMR